MGQRPPSLPCRAGLVGTPAPGRPGWAHHRAGNPENYGQTVPLRGTVPLIR
jgi:hypothetical protein